MNAQTTPKLDAAMQSIGIRYIGNKEKKTDNVCGTDAVWDGFGSIVAVPVHVAQRLLVSKYKDVWQRETDTPPEPNGAQRAVLNARNAVRAHGQKMASLPKRPQSEYVTVPLPDVIDAICTLTELADAAEHFGEDNRPKLESVRKQLGKNINQQQVTQAWDEINSSRA